VDVYGGREQIEIEEKREGKQKNVPRGKRGGGSRGRGFMRKKGSALCLEAKKYKRRSGETTEVECGKTEKNAQEGHTLEKRKASTGGAQKGRQFQEKTSSNANVGKGTGKTKRRHGTKRGQGEEREKS